MSFRIPPPGLVPVSLALGALVLVLSNPFASSGYGGSWALLSVDASWPDRYIGKLLSRQGLDYVSESTQWVFLDDFGELERIPLDEYRDRVESFDPRDDGYAEKLRAYFVRGGERRFFIPLAASFSTKSLEAALASSLGDISFSYTPLGGGRPLLWYGILFVLAALGTLVFSARSPALAALLPLMGGALFSGPAGFALCTVLWALAACLRFPLGDFFRFRRRRALRPYLPRFPWGAVLALLALYTGVCVLGGIRPVLGAALFAGFCVVFPLCLLAGPGGKGHRRFEPLMILDSPRPLSSLPRFLIPFPLAAVLALLPAPFLPGPAREKPVEPLPSGEDYRRHAAFQAAFSFLPPAGEGFNQSAYLRYYLGDDGLIAGAEDFSLTAVSREGEIPPFPLEGLTAFLAEGRTGPQWPPAPGDMLPVGLLFFSGLPALIWLGAGRRKRVRMAVFNVKRIAA